MSLPKKPYFMKWVIVDENGWRLKEGAPESVKDDYEKWLKEMEDVNKQI